MGGNQTNTSAKGKVSIQEESCAKRETEAEVFRRYIHLWGISLPRAPGVEGRCVRLLGRL